MKGIRISLIGWYLLTVLFVVLSLICLTGCKTQYVPVKEIHTEYVTRTDSFIRTDSLYLHDSILVREKGDTVTIEKWHTRYRDRIVESIKTDTFIQRDTIPVPYPVEKRLSWWQQRKQDFGEIMLVLLAIAAFCIFWKHKRSFLDS
jgi:hypothetical protein